jgi:chemotaxis signal transduction protein
MIDGKNMDELTGLVIFEIAGKEFCADIKDISAIINPAELKLSSDIGSADEHQVLINNLNIPIVDIHKLYGFEQKDGNGEKRILLLEIKNKMFGFFVEKVKEIFTSSKEFAQKLKFIPYEGKEYLTGVLTYEGRRFFIPDYLRVVNQQLPAEKF